MKSTYKLFGTYWDGMKGMRYGELNFENNPVRSSESISFQKLLSVQNETDLDRIIASYEPNNEITIQIDYWTETSNPILHTFLEKRLGQMVAHLSEKYPTVRCVQV